MSEIVMPRLSDTMEEGTILRWLKADGEHVDRGEELVEIETDKATMTYESDQSGTLRLIAAEGESLAVGQPIATVGEASEDGEGPASRPAGSHERERSAAADVPNAGEATAREGSAAAGARTGASEGTAAAGSLEGARGERPSGSGEGGRVKASPLARRVARESGLDLAAIAGTGPGGRVVRADVVANTGGHSGAAPDAIATAKGNTSEVELSRVQQTIARRMAESKATIPDFTMQLDVDMEACVALRGELKTISERRASGRRSSGEEDPVPTYNDMVVKACALALQEFPLANGSYRDGRLLEHSRINVGVAVAAERALVVPTIFDADEKSLGEISRATRTLAGRVRDGSITPPELGGGTFTVSNLGMFGIRSFTAIINPPQAAIVSVGALEPRAVVRDGEIVARSTMSLTLVSDHRILYGAEAAGFLARIREMLQTPAALTL